ncbi:MAG: hypothetical protein U0746_17240 [Gemmataceae bacterium]
MHLRTTLNGRRNVSRVEALEARLTPSVTASQLGNGTIIVSGTSNSEAIQVNDNGPTTTVYANGYNVGTFANSNGNYIDIFGNGGGDVVSYNVLGNATPKRNILAYLGTGTNSFRANVVAVLPTPTTVAPTLGALAANSNLYVEVHGNTGNDTMGLSALGINANANLTFTGTGDAGKDSFTANVGYANGLGQAAGTHTRFDFDGGIGDDYANVTLQGDLQYGSTAYVNLSGGTGVDKLYAYTLNGVMAGYTNFALSGGDNDDIIYVDYEMKAGSNLGQAYLYVYGGAGNDTVTALFHKARSADTSVGNFFLYGQDGNDKVTTNMARTAVVSSFETIVNVA